MSIESTAHIHDGVRFLSAAASQDNKLKVLSDWRVELGLDWDEVAYMGDDEPDIPCF